MTTMPFGYVPMDPQMLAYVLDLTAMKLEVEQETLAAGSEQLAATFDGDPFVMGLYAYEFNHLLHPPEVTS